jgi:uncharacterized membrane protein
MLLDPRAMTWILLATISALLSAAAAVVQKRVLFRLPALEFSFLVTLATLVLSLSVPLTTDVRIPPEAMAVLVVKSLVGGTAFLLVMLGLEHGPISATLPLMGLTPAVTALLAQFLLGDVLGVAQWAGLALMTAGTWALEARAGGGPLRPLGEVFTAKRHRFMLGAVVLFAVSSVADQLLVTGLRVPPSVVLFYQHIVYAMLFAAILAWRGGWTRMARGASSQWPLILAIAILTIGYRWFQLTATQTGPVALVLAVKRTSIVYASLLGGRLFAEQRLAPRLAGAGLIVAAGFLFLRFQ